MNVPWTFVTVRPFLKTLNYRLWPFNLTFINVFGLKTVSIVGLSETFRCYMMNDPKCLQNHVHGMFIDHWLKTLFKRDKTLCLYELTNYKLKCSVTIDALLFYATKSQFFIQNWVKKIFFYFVHLSIFFFFPRNPRNGATEP